MICVNSYADIYNHHYCKACRLAGNHKGYYNGERTHCPDYSSIATSKDKLIIQLCLAIEAEEHPQRMAIMA